MMAFFKYCMYFFIIFILSLTYFLFTSSGQSVAYNIISQKLSKDNGIDIKVHSINLKNYPQEVSIMLYIEKKTKLILNGYLDYNLVDMNYTLLSDCINTKDCRLDDNIHLDGHIEGVYQKLLITGHGHALDGNIDYNATKNKNQIKNLTVQANDINTTKLENLLKQKFYITGKSNIRAKFSSISNKEKHGTISYRAKNSNYKHTKLQISSDINISNEKYIFKARIQSSSFVLKIIKGQANQKNKKINASYLLDIKELSKLEYLLGYAYKGSFYARGEISYANKIKITGLSKSFNGLLDFSFLNDTLKMKLNKVSFRDILYLLDAPSLLDAQTSGNIDYSFKTNRLKAHTILNRATFLPSMLANTVKKQSHIDITHETFDNSKLDLSYHNDIIFANLQLANAFNHFSLKQTKINMKQNTIDTYFDFKMQHQEFTGDIHGPLSNPKINLNLQKLIRYQMDKQVDKIIGKNGRKIMENMPMENVAKDMVTDIGTSIIKVFF